MVIAKWTEAFAATAAASVLRGCVVAITRLATQKKGSTKLYARTGVYRQ